MMLFMSIDRTTRSCWDFINTWAIGENQAYPYLRTVLPEISTKTE